MQKFKDATGKEWSLNITLGTIERVREATGVNLAKLFDDDLRIMGELFADPASLAVVILAVANPAATAEDKSAFFDALAGESLEAAANALVDAVVDFFPNPKRRELLREMFRKAWGLVNAAVDQATAKLAELDLTSLLSAGNSQASSASTPSPSPSVNSP